MKWELVYTRQARKDAKQLAAAGLKEKALELLKLLERNPFEAPPPYREVAGGSERRLFPKDQYPAPTRLPGDRRRARSKSDPHVVSLRVRAAKIHIRPKSDHGTSQGISSSSRRTASSRHRITVQPLSLFSYHPPRGGNG